jgi:hypothetical protein
MSKVKWTKDMTDSVKPHSKHVLIFGGAADWPQKIEKTEGKEKREREREREREMRRRRRRRRRRRK